MEEATRFAMALSDPTRWRILLLLWEQPLCVCELADILKMPQSSVSSHIQVIRRAGMLDCERREKWLYYRVNELMRPPLEALRTHFNIDAASHRITASDAQRMTKRLSVREKSCCPAPVELARKPSPAPLRSSRRMS